MRDSPENRDAPLRRGQRFVGVLFSLPAVVLLTLFLVAPLVIAAGLSLTDHKLVSPLPVEFVGLRNYVAVLSDATFRRAALNTALFAVIVVPVQTGLALLLAVLVHQGLRGSALFRSLFFMPSVVVLTVGSVIWMVLYDPQGGMAAELVSWATFGTVEPSWLRSPSTVLVSVAIMSIWQGAGFQMTLLLAGLSNIPVERYEAALLDGATRRQQFVHITLPGLRRTLVCVLLITTILAFRLFDQVWVMTHGGPLNRSRTLVLHLVETLQRNDLGEASAVAVVFFVLVLGLTAALRLVARES